MSSSFSHSYSSHADGRREPTAEQMARYRRSQDLSTPPENMLPATWPLAVLLSHTDEVAISVLGAHVYPTGMTMRIVVVSRKQQDDPHALQALSLLQRARGGLNPDNILRLGVRYSDGRSWSSLGQPDFLQTMLEEDFDETAPRLMPMSGSGNGRTYEQGVYLTPLPPDGPLEFLCAWPRHSIPETSATVDVTGISAAAAHAVQLWPLDESEPEYRQPPRLKLGDKGDAFFPPILGQEPGSAG